MNKKNTLILVLEVLLCCGGCTNTRYLTDSKSIGRQHDMRKHRSGVNAGDALLSIVNLFVSNALDSEYEISQSDRAFKRMTIVNESPDSLYVNMVTDIVWKEDGYCDIMGIVLPPDARQKLLVPYPAAYNVYFKTPFSGEEKIEFRSDNKHRILKLRAGMTDWLNEK